MHCLRNRARRKCEKDHSKGKKKKERNVVGVSSSLLFPRPNSRTKTQREREISTTYPRPSGLITRKHRHLRAIHRKSHGWALLCFACVGYTQWVGNGSPMLWSASTESVPPKCANGKSTQLRYVTQSGNSILYQNLSLCTRCLTLF